MAERERGGRDMNGTCFECKFMRQRTNLESCEYCTNVFAMTGVHPNFEAKCKPITNYDRIISKSPEEMAEWLGDKDTCPPGACKHMYDGVDCPECWLDWLKQEATDAK